MSEKSSQTAEVNVVNKTCEPANAPKKKEKVCTVPWPEKLITAIPFYGDLGKHARDIFSKGYHFGLIKLDVKTVTKTGGVEFKTGGYSNMEDGKVFGSLEAKYKFKEYGTILTERWNTDNILATELALTDFCEGAKISCDTTFSPANGDKTLKLKAEFRNDSCALNLDTDFKKGGPILKGGCVVGIYGWLCGAQTSFDTANTQLTDTNFTMGMATKDFIINSSINDSKVFDGSVFIRATNKIEAGINLSWASESNETSFGIGCKYNLDSESAIRVKVDNERLIGVGFSQRLADGVTLYLSAQVDSKNIDEGGHKIGLCLELES